MNNFRITAPGGGIFSRYMRIIKQASILSYDKINLKDDKDNINCFDWIFKQEILDTYQDIEINGDPFKKYNNKNHIEKSASFESYKNVVKSLEFTEDFVSKLNYFEKQFITSETIGVHVRITDMNTLHPQYGIYYIDDFLKLLQKDKKYFIASDNEESLKKIKNIYGDNISYIPNLIRAKKETENSTQMQEQNIKNKIFWTEAFLEMMLLSKCSSLICRTSNVAFSSLVHSDSIKNVIRL